MSLCVLISSTAVFMLLVTPVLSYQKDVPKIGAGQTSEDIKKLQEQFFYILENEASFRNADNLTSTLKAFGGEDGKKLLKSFVDAVVPTLGHENSKELMYNFWLRLLATVPPSVSKNLLQIESVFNQAESLPAALSALATGGENSPVIELVSAFLPDNINVTDLIKSFASSLNGKEGGNDQLIPKMLHLAKPLLDDFLHQNNVDLQADAIMQIVGNLASAKTGKRVNGKKKNDFNPMKLLLPLMGMLGKQGSKGGSNLVEGMMGLLGGKGGDGANLMEGVMGMLGGKGGEKDILMEGVMSLLNGKGDGNNMMEGLIGMLSGKGGENNLLEGLMGMLGDGKMGGGGGDNMMGMMMSMMSKMGSNKKKKNNDKIEMLATVLDFVSNVGMGKNGKKGHEMAGMAQMAMNLLNQPNKNEEKKMSDQKPPKIAGRGASASKNKR